MTLTSVKKDCVASEDEFSSSTTPQPEKRVQLFDQYEDKTEEVRKQFTVLKENQYIGRLKNVYSAANEFMTCDCTEELDSEGYNDACGPDSDCINRLTNIECVNGECNCGDNCLNQRFQIRDYANTAVFLTENKGYGMRAQEDIPAQTFIIEYMGDVIDSQEYKERKENYGKEGIKHFYFMMMQDDEIIDATKRASFGRYCNHSCDPNAFIEKWVVNKRYRMGIFAKRRIAKGEEICFDYNVDRYGAEPQKCYCGAANCLGVMGGKTQSETVRLLPHIITEALGVRASDEKKWLKEQRRNGVSITADNVDSNVNVEFVKSLDLKPADISDIAKISSCLMQPELDLLVIDRVLERLVTGADEPLDILLARFNRLHGVQALGNSLKTLLNLTKNTYQLNSDHLDVFRMILLLFKRWPELKYKNSIQNSEILESFTLFKEKGLPSEMNDDISLLSEKWSKLEVIYRIPKKNESSNNYNNDGSLLAKKILDDRRSRSSETVSPSTGKIPTGPSPRLKLPWSDINIDSLPENRKMDGIPLPPGWEWAIDTNTKVKYFFNRARNVTQWQKPEWNIPDEEDIKRKRREREKERDKVKEMKNLRLLERQRALKRQTDLRLEEQRHNDLSSIIAQATKSLENQKSDLSNGKISSRKKSNGSSSSATASPASHSKEGRWKVLLASVVPNIVARYEKEIGKEQVKFHSKQLVHTLAGKELKKRPDAEVPDSLSAERKSKIKIFVKDYMEKVIRKHKEKKRSLKSEDDFDTKKQKV